MATTSGEGTVAADESSQFPHIRVRVVNDEPEPYVQGTGLAVWEVVWLSRAYRGNNDGVRGHLRVGTPLIEEALAYARVYPSWIDPAVRTVEEGSIARLEKILPGIRPYPPEPTDNGGITQHQTGTHTESAQD